MFRLDAEACGFASEADFGRDATRVVVPAGGMEMHHPAVPHSSERNTSGRPRRLMIYTHHPASHAVPLDVRNGPTRLNESPWEMEYMRAKVRGEYEDTFAAPTYDDFNAGLAAEKCRL